MILTVTLNPSIDKLYLVDALTDDTVMRVRECRNTPGGKGLNVSRAAARLGEPVTAMGFLGGFNGQYLESLLEGSGVTSAFTHTDSETRSCINVWDASRSRSTEFLEPGAPVSPHDWERFLKDFTDRLPSADAVTISGSAPQGVPADAYPRLIALCREREIPVLLDASGERLVSGIRALPTLVKPNTDEISAVTGRNAGSFPDILQALKELHGAGVACPVVSMGAEGAVLLCSDGSFRGTPPVIEPRNTVGCGDVMLAGFAVGYARRLPVEDRFRTALAASAASALSPYTGDFDPEDFERMLSLVRIDPMSA